MFRKKIGHIFSIINFIIFIFYPSNYLSLFTGTRRKEKYKKISCHRYGDRFGKI